MGCLPIYNGILSYLQLLYGFPEYSSVLSSDGVYGITVVKSPCDVESCLLKLLLLLLLNVLRPAQLQIHRFG